MNENLFDELTVQQLEVLGYPKTLFPSDIARQISDKKWGNVKRKFFNPAVIRLLGFTREEWNFRMKSGFDIGDELDRRVFMHVVWLRAGDQYKAL